MAFNFNSVMDKVILFIIIVALVPTALVSFFNVTTTTWDLGTVAIWGILAIVFIVGLMKGLMGSSKGR